MKAMFAALGILASAGCGPLDKIDWKWATSPLPDAGQLGAAEAKASDDVWAEKAFALYGGAAVETCLTAFHQDLVNGDGGLGFRGKGVSYRGSLADFMCACARGQSAEACPEP
jgi:hypothetical protein